MGGFFVPYILLNGCKSIENN